MQAFLVQTYFSASLIQKGYNKKWINIKHHVETEIRYEINNYGN